MSLLLFRKTYCPFHKHENSKVQKPPSQLRFSLPSIIIRSQATNLETEKHTKRIEIHQSQITNLDFLNLLKMIDFSEKRNRQLAFELQNSHVCEKRSKKKTKIAAS